MSESHHASLPASTSNPSTSNPGADAVVTRPIWGTLAVAAMSFAACLMTGFVPAGFIPTALVGPFLLASWCVGAVAFACSVGPDTRPVDQAIRYHAFRQAEQRTASRKAA
jgi:hypothetical protein